MAALPLLTLLTVASVAAGLPQKPNSRLDLRADSGGALPASRGAAEIARASAGASASGADDYTRPAGVPASLHYEHETMQHLVFGAGYPLEEHFVTTADGYVLGVYRIPRGRTRSPSSSAGFSAGAGAGAGSGSGSRPPALLLHGVLDSSAAWVLNEPHQSLGFILADAGFDVWLGNSRGNQFSRNHTGLDPRRAQFWDFSWDEMAAYDVPAMVDHVLAHNGAAQVAYVGHSQATTQMFAALASQPALRSRLSMVAALGPAVHMRHIHAPALKVLAAMGVENIFALFGAHEFLPTRKAAADLFSAMCATEPLACSSIITAIAGFNAANMNLTRLPTMVQYAPSGTSVKNMAHWAQAIRKSWEREQPLFQMYDYGNTCYTPTGLPQTCNMRVYHAVEPPSYHLGSITSPPLALFYGGRDRLADAADVASLLRALPADNVVYTQFEPEYEHIDFTWGIDACRKVYPAVVQLLQRFSVAPAHAEA